MIDSPGRGLGLKMPNGVAIAPGSPATANDGRSVKSVSPLLSRPVRMLNGRPDNAVKEVRSSNLRGSGTLKETFPRWRRSSDDGPYSVVRSFESAGIVREPSESLRRHDRV